MNSSSSDEALIAAFELAWASGPTPPDLGTWLATRAEPIASRATLLVELACIDMEWRWKQADRVSPWSAADYTNYLADIGLNGSVPVELIGEEYRAQLHRGKVDQKAFWARPSYDTPAARQLVEEIQREQSRESQTLQALSVRATDSQTSSAARGAPLQTDLPHVDFSAITLRRIVGAGRSAKVYEATMNANGARVAAKFLRKEFLAAPEAVEFFFREGAILAQLDHPRIVRLLGIGETRAGGRFLLLDWMAGDLTRHIGNVSWNQGLPWMLDAADALAAAHQHGVLHCDLKPSNLLRDNAGRVRLADFGLARTLSERPSESWIVEGTAPYMAPEQASPAWGDVGPTTDVFGLGAVFYALLVGHPPWPGRSVAEAVTRAASGATVADIREKRPDIPETIAHVIMKCLSKSPNERFSSMDDTQNAMRQIMDLPP